MTIGDQAFALPESCWGVAVAVLPTAPAALTPLAGCRAGLVEDMASNPPRNLYLPEGACALVSGAGLEVVCPKSNARSSGFRWCVGGALEANVLAPGT